MPPEAFPSLCSVTWEPYWPQLLLCYVAGRSADGAGDLGIAGLVTPCPDLLEALVQHAAPY